MGMVERVAREICKNAGHVTDRHWQHYTNAARAAIEAMRELDDAMVNVGVAFALSATVSGDGGWPRYVSDKHRAMIDKALEDAP